MDSSASMSPTTAYFKWYRSWYALRWRLATSAFAKPMPFLTANFDVKLGDCLLMLPIVAALTAWCVADVASLSTSASGTPASIALLLVFVLTVRNNSLLLVLTGLPFDRAILYHKVFAVITIVLSLLHALSYLLKHHKIYGSSRDPNRVFTDDEYDDAKSSAAVTGMLTLVPMVLLLMMSLPPIRRRFFEFFVRTHWLLFIVVIVGAIIHNATLGVFGAVLWLLDMLYRMVYQTRVYKSGAFWKAKERANENNPAATEADNTPKPSRLGVLAPGQVSISRVASNVVCIQFPKVRADTGECFQYEAGQYAFLCVPAISLWEWHPFTISSAPHESMTTFHVRVLGNWTTKLLHFTSPKLSNEAVQLDLLVDGPYGNVSIDIMAPATYSHVVLFSGGIGITPMKSIVNHLHNAHTLKIRPELERVRFVWSVRDREMVRAFTSSDASNEPKSYFPYGLTDSGVPNSSGMTLGFTTELFLTKGECDLEDPLDQKLRHCMRYYTRPDIIAVLREIGQEAQLSKKDRVGVLVCGPSAMIHEVIIASIMLTREMQIAITLMREMKINFDVHTESFDF
uniref:FAD-binding FR-type domain-containing protein n=1 Tax=Globisporangium ultimum (strain ATCC 200006 / CBS 805.95 / DAOM BR144) TaxID=431595 RepID=K3XCF6_GLOUD